MGKKNKKNQNFAQEKGPVGGGGFKNKENKNGYGYGQGKAQLKQQKIMEKENEFISKFEQRQEEKSAVLLKDELTTPSQKKQFETNGSVTKQQKAMKNTKCNDGLSTANVLLKQQLKIGPGNLQGKQSVKRKFDSSSDDSDSTPKDKGVNGNESGSAMADESSNVFESIILGKGDKEKQKNVRIVASTPKRKRVASSSDSSNSDTTAKIINDSGTSTALVDDLEMKAKKTAVNGKAKVNSVPDEIESVDSDISDEEGHDLEKFAPMDDAMEDEEEGELTDMGSFIAEDEELEDGYSSTELSDSHADTIDLDILGYNTIKADANCLVLQAENGYTIATSPFKLHKFSPNGLDEHSEVVALQALRWILSPVDPPFFFSNIFQKRVLVVKRSAASYFDGFFSVQAFTRILQNNFLEYCKDLNIASYENGQRQTHNTTTEGLRITPATISAQLAKGRSIQCVHPQVFDDHIWYLCEVLQEVFCSFVGANNYLTPADSAGFAPHWDDIDAFMLQLEGRKYWKVYSPEQPEDTLPLESSCNFTDDDFKGRQPVFEGWLEPGDLLYVPRGFVHQANTGPEMHSHHVTISVCRRYSYADLFQLAGREFTAMLTSKSKRLRTALPPCILDMDGAVKVKYPNENSLEKRLLPVAEIYARKFAADFSLFIPDYIDLMAQEFFKTALPPLLSAEEREFSCFGGQQFDLMGGPVEFGSETEVRLIRKHAQRLLLEDEERAFIVHRMANSRRFDESAHGSDFDFPIEYQQAYITLTDSYPKWTKLRDLGLGKEEMNNSAAKLLFENGLLLRKQSSDGGGKKQIEKGEEGEEEPKKKRRGKKNKKNKFAQEEE